MGLHTECQEKGYPSETRTLAFRMYVEGSSQRSIARILKISPQSVSNWIGDYISKPPPVPMSQRTKMAELGELCTLLKQKKPCLCLLSWDAIYERSTANLQACLERSP